MNDPQPLVSIIVPVYNTERYLPYCIDSILGQSYTNIEVILVDDGATDSSPSICDNYAAQDTRITVIHQSNGGIAKAQNTGLDAAHGEFIAFADNDDILDRRNIEYLLHAIQRTGADMSKARWNQFGVSRIEEIAAAAHAGTDSPASITVVRSPLRDYQTTFCKTLRLLGDSLGHHSETRYFNEANWCRLYRRTLWDGIRFPEGMYAQDVMVAGMLYERMAAVADVDAVLYYWLQSTDSVTHSKRSFRFYHDNVRAGIMNFRLAMHKGITPARSYYTIREELHQATRTKEYVTDPSAAEQYRQDRAEADSLIRKLSPVQRIRCTTLAVLRYMEKNVYDKCIKNLR